jgi:hypothetical protein
MSAKLNGKAAAPKKEETKKDKDKGGAPAKVKAAKVPEKEAASPVEEVSGSEPEDTEEEEVSESGGPGGGNAAALAAAANSTGEMSASFKNFRHHPDMENFYRFIFENDLRIEALTILDEMMLEKHQRKLVKGKSSAH